MAQFDEYTADGTQTVFSYKFPAFEQADIAVSIDNVVQTSGFVIRGLGAGNGGAVEFDAAPANGALVRIERVKTSPQVAFLEKSLNLSDLDDVATARANLGLGTAALLDAGTDPGNVVQLDGAGALPAVDGSALTGIADVKAKVSATDTTAGFLAAKLVAGANITLTTLDPGGAETLSIASRYDVVTADTTLTVGSAQAYPTITAALATLAGKFILPGITVTIDVAAGTVTEPDVVVIDHPQSGQIVIQGQSPTSTTLSAYVSHTGSRGDYQVVFDVASSSGIAAGDCVIISATSGGTGHEVWQGCWEVLSVPSSTRIEVRNTQWCNGIKGTGITGGTVKVMKSVIRPAVGKGLFFVGRKASLRIQNAALLGRGTSSGIEATYGFSELVASLNLGVCAFVAGIDIAGPAFADLTGVAVSACGDASSGYGIGYRYGAVGLSTSSIVTGCRTGVMVAFNATANLNSAVVAGCQSPGLEVIMGQVSADSSHFIYNSYSLSHANVLAIAGTTRMHNAVILGEVAYGIYVQQGAVFDASWSSCQGAITAEYGAIGSSYIRAYQYAGTGTFSPALNTVGNGNSFITDN